jgi:hypothetical protein
MRGQGNLLMPHKIKGLATMKCIRRLVLLLALTTTPAVSSAETKYELAKKSTGWKANGMRGLQNNVPTPTTAPSASAVPTPAPSTADQAFLNEIAGFGDKEELDTGICDCVFCEEDEVCGGLWFGEEEQGDANNFVSGANRSFSQPNASCQQLLITPFCPFAFLSTDEDSYSCVPLYQRS